MSCRACFLLLSEQWHLEEGLVVAVHPVVVQDQRVVDHLQRAVCLPAKADLTARRDLVGTGTESIPWERLEQIGLEGGVAGRIDRHQYPELIAGRVRGEAD